MSDRTFTCHRLVGTIRCGFTGGNELAGAHWQETGHGHWQQSTSPKVCILDGCDSFANRRDRICARHHSRWLRHGNYEGLRPHVSTLERFLRFMPKGLPRDVCWEWQGGLCSGSGYGSFFVRHGDGTTSSGAHRASYELFVAPIPAGLLVMHSCDNRPCVNPAHLSLGTVRDNAEDMSRKGRASWANTCQRGHPWTAESTRWQTLDGERRARRCRTCRREQDKIRYAKRTAA